jgi:hypothetical protein
MYNSGESEKCLGITRSRSHQDLVEAAWIAIRKDTEMQNYYRKHQGKKCHKVAHKMARRIFQSLKQKHLIKLIEI